MGAWARQRLSVELVRLHVGAVMFVIFGAFFETIFRSFGVAHKRFGRSDPSGRYLVIVRSGLFPSEKG
jgi:hypothetical protein